MTWSIDVEAGGLVRLDPGGERPQLKEALEDCVGSVSPAGTPPRLSTYWIDLVLAGLSSVVPLESVIASANAWSFVRHGDMVTARFDYSEEGEEESETIPVDELVVGLSVYREAVLEALENGHQLDERWWAQRNPY